MRRFHTLNKITINNNCNIKSVLFNSIKSVLEICYNVFKGYFCIFLNNDLVYGRNYNEFYLFFVCNNIFVPVHFYIMAFTYIIKSIWINNGIMCNCEFNPV